MLGASMLGGATGKLPPALRDQFELVDSIPPPQRTAHQRALHTEIATLGDFSAQIVHKPIDARHLIDALVKVDLEPKPPEAGHNDYWCSQPSCPHLKMT
jgi:hypothetical protein